MLPVILVLFGLACGGASVRGEGDQKKEPARAIAGQELNGTKREGKGHVISVKGPCGDRRCCKAIVVTLPTKLEPKVFSPRMAIRLAVAPDGNIGKVEITKSSGNADVDRQVREGAG